uniref:(northern house mosquito) hypothetical protein n=1 Tax=Culex pipiens TaxID=7175 RepID=A0A8D8L5T3_CULPI
MFCISYPSQLILLLSSSTLVLVAGPPSSPPRCRCCSGLLVVRSSSGPRHVIVHHYTHIVKSTSTTFTHSTQHRLAPANQSLVNHLGTHNGHRSAAQYQE